MDKLIIPFHKRPTIIGIHGHARAGKDTVADYISTQYADSYIEAFAAPLKEVCSALYGVDINLFYSVDLKEVRISYWDQSPREMAQFIGTEIIRNSLGVNHWIRKMFARITGDSIRPEIEGKYEAVDTIIIPDVRFENEIEWILANDGFIINLTREGADGTVGIPGHESEREVDFSQFSQAGTNVFLIPNNGTLEELYVAVDEMMKHTELDGKTFL